MGSDIALTWEWIGLALLSALATLIILAVLFGWA